MPHVCGVDGTGGDTSFTMGRLPRSRKDANLTNTAVAVEAAGSAARRAPVAPGG